MDLIFNLLPLTFDPPDIWSSVALAVAGVSGMLLLIGLVWPKTRLRMFGRRLPTQLIVLSFWLLAAGLLAAAACNPVLMRGRASDGPFLAVAIDVSDSVIRSQGGWPVVQKQIFTQLKASIDELPPDLKRTAQGGVVTFGNGASTASSDVPITDLPQVVTGIRSETFAAGGESDLSAGLARAGRLVQDGGGQGAVVLFSDGLQTQGDALATAYALASQGLAITVVPISGSLPAVSLRALDLPRRVEAGASTFVRGLLYNSHPDPVQARLSLQINAGAPNRVGPADEIFKHSFVDPLPGSRFVRLHEQITFSGAGLQFIELSLQTEGASVEHRRRLYTFVHEPPRLLAIGGDQSWVSAFPSSDILITPIHPTEVTADLDLSGFDAIVINDVAADQFISSALEQIANAVTQNSVGLFLINGPHTGIPVTEPSRLRSYGSTPIDSLLPVTPDLRAEIPEPPPRQVVFLIDASGSMTGVPLEKAKEIARHLVEKYLRPQDTLDLLSFTTGAAHLIKQQFMDPVGKQLAIQEINRISAGGYTEPNAALAQIANRRLQNCGLVFISDGGFAAVNYRPDCQTVVFAIGQSQVPDPASPLWDLAEPIPTPYDFNPASIEVPYFKPKPRDKFFEPDAFVPFSVDQNAGQYSELPVPLSTLPGSAVTFPRQEAEVIAVHPNKTLDPVLVYRRDTGEGGGVGVLTSALTPEWLAGEAERSALRSWLMRVMAYSARDRYDIQITDRGSRTEIVISVLPGDGELIPDVKGLAGWLEVDRQRVADLALVPDAVTSSSFHGLFQLSYTNQPKWARLVLQETGIDALRTIQKIPFLLPPQTAIITGLTSEDNSFGVDEALLQQLAEAGGGVYDPVPGTPAFPARLPEQPMRSLWPWFAAAGMLAYLLAFLTRRLEAA